MPSDVVEQVAVPAEHFREIDRAWRRVEKRLSDGRLWELQGLREGSFPWLPEYEVFSVGECRLLATLCKGATNDDWGGVPGWLAPAEACEIFAWIGRNLPNVAESRAIIRRLVEIGPELWEVPTPKGWQSIGSAIRASAVHVARRYSGERPEEAELCGRTLFSYLRHLDEGTEISRSAFRRSVEEARRHYVHDLLRTECLTVVFDLESLYATLTSAIEVATSTAVAATHGRGAKSHELAAEIGQAVALQLANKGIDAISSAIVAAQRRN